MRTYLIEVASGLTVVLLAWMSRKADWYRVVWWIEGRQTLKIIDDISNPPGTQPEVIDIRIPVIRPDWLESLLDKGPRTT
jgi:hypothetical protein